MKKVFAVIIILTVLFCGCTPKVTDKQSLPTRFDSTAEIKFDDMTYEVFLTRFDNGIWRAELNAPTAVKGLIFNINGSETEISFKGLHFTFDTSKFPVGAVVNMAAKSFDKLVSSDLDVVKGDTTDFASGEIDGMTYSMTLDKNGTPLTLSLGNSGMEITFTTFEEIEGSEEISENPPVGDN